MFCKSCGTEIPDESKFCLACGTNVSDTVYIEAATAPKSNLMEIRRFHAQMKSLLAVAIVECVFTIVVIPAIILTAVFWIKYAGIVIPVIDDAAPEELNEYKSAIAKKRAALVISLLPYTISSLLVIMVAICGGF